MSENTYAVAFSGTLVEGADSAKVKANFAQLFKLEATKVEHLFSGKRVVIKKGVDQQTAEKYKLALHKAGAIVEIINLAATSTAAQKPAPATATPEVTQENTPSSAQSVQVAASGGAMDSVTVAEPGAVLIAAEEVPELQVDVSSMDMAEPGVVLIAAEEVPDLQVDVSAMDMAEPGVVLVAAEEVPDLQVDVSAMDMAEPGVVLVVAEEVPELQLDVSAMDMAEPGVVLIQAEDVPEPAIDISALSVEEPEPEKPKNPFM